MELKPKKNDYLKYWRVIRYYVKAKYGLTQADLDMILFLYSEKYFDSEKFDEYSNLISWDKTRRARLIKEGWIQIFRHRNKNTKVIYCLSYKASRMVDSIYKKLNGDEIPDSSSKNPIYLKKVPYSHRAYRKMIEEMNEFIRQQQRHVPE
jgi:hypothetical protein